MTKTHMTSSQVIASALGLALVFAASGAFGQDNTPPPDHAKPNAATAPKAGGTTHGAVIKPPPTVDRGFAKQPPASGPMPVIKPPQTSKPQPKVSPQ